MSMHRDGFKCPDCRSYSHFGGSFIYTSVCVTLAMHGVDPDDLGRCLHFRGVLVEGELRGSTLHVHVCYVGIPCFGV